MKYIIQDKEAGNIIEHAPTLQDAEDIIIQYENQDKKEGTYTSNFYEIIKK